MPRVSQAASLIPRVDGRPERLEPPQILSAPVAAIFRRLVAATQPEHFAPGDMPLLVQYCEAIRLCDEACEHLRDGGAVADGKVNPWLIVYEKASRMLVALSARLRLSPQHRYSKDKANTSGRGPLPFTPDWSKLRADNGT